MGNFWKSGHLAIKMFRRERSVRANMQAHLWESSCSSSAVLLGRHTQHQSSLFLIIKSVKKQNGSVGEESRNLQMEVDFQTENVSVQIFNLKPSHSKCCFIFTSSLLIYGRVVRDPSVPLGRPQLVLWLFLLNQRPQTLGTRY